MFRSGQKLGKYRLQARISDGPFATVYRAFDTLEGVQVALKVPHPHLVTKETLEDFSREVRLAAKLDHPNILGLKTADYVDGHFLIAFPLGDESLHDRLQRRMSLRTAVDLGEQLLRAVAFAHAMNIIHCDVKPDNLLLFSGGRLRLTDFGISRVAQRTVSAFGEGTVGYMAPEQAMGRPSVRSDVFAVGLVLWEMFSGQLPEWPFEWPLAGHDRIKYQFHPDMVALLRRSLELKPDRRFRDCRQMLAAYLRVKPKAIRHTSMKTTRRKKSTTKRDWRVIRQRQFLKQFGRQLATQLECGKCGGPVSECMHTCPWCGVGMKVLHEETTFPSSCPRCKRGMKLDWVYCPWCYGPGFEEATDREFSDRRYVARCRNRKCTRKELMQFMRYCPWCHLKVKQSWKIEGSDDTCGKCGWGVLRHYWSHCPWCGTSI